MDTKRTASATASSRSSRGERTVAHAVCIDPADCKASLAFGKAHLVQRPARGAPLGKLRIIDGTDEDACFPVSMLVKVDLPRMVRQALATAAFA